MGQSLSSRWIYVPMQIFFYKLHSAINQRMTMAFSSMLQRCSHFFRVATADAADVATTTTAAYAEDTAATTAASTAAAAAAFVFF